MLRFHVNAFNSQQYNGHAMLRFHVNAFNSQQYKGHAMLRFHVNRYATVPHCVPCFNMLCLPSST
jgi:hypothetical protein